MKNQSNVTHTHRSGNSVMMYQIASCGASECGNGSGNCSCSGSGCASGCDNSGGGVSCASTPFLATYDKDGNQRVLNDVMMGNPSALFKEKKDGAQSFLEGKVGFDIYPVPLKDLERTDAYLNVSIREIEPEHSYIHELSYGFLTVPQSKVIATDYTYQKLYTVEPGVDMPEEIRHSGKEDVRLILNKDTVTTYKTLDEYKQNSLLLQRNEFLLLKVTQDIKDSYISIGCFWREPLSRSHYIERIQKIESNTKQKYLSPWPMRLFNKARATLLSVAVFFLPVLFFANSVNDSALIQNAIDFKKAHASVPGRSLYLYYKTSEGKWHFFAIIHPRHLLTMDTLVKVPSEAFIDGVADVKIEASQDHYIYNIGIRTKVDILETSDMKPMAGTSDKVMESTVGNGVVLETGPGDEYKFKVPVPVKNETHMVLKIHGYYVPALQLTDRQLAQWWSSLRDEEKALYLN